MNTLPALPAPLTPSDCDLRSYDWFPLFHKRLQRSAWWLRASAEAKATSVELWCEAYQQVPAASLPNEDIELATAAGFGRRDVASWLLLKQEVMSPWILCSDGRWYHPVLAEVARDAWAIRDEKRRKERDKKARQRERQRLNEGGSPDSPEGKPPSVPPGTDPGCPPISGGHGTTGQDKTRQDIEGGGAKAPPLLAPEEAIGTDRIADAFEVFWQTYPKRTEKPRALKGYRAALKALDGSLTERIAFLQQQAERFRDHFGEESHFAVPPTTWLKDQRWHDELKPRRPAAGAPAGRTPSDSQLDRAATMLAGAVAAVDRRR